MRQGWMRAALAALALGAGGALVVVPSAPAAAEPGGTFQFGERTRSVDTRDGAPLAAGTPLAVTGPRFLNVAVTEPQAAGSLTIGPCGGGPRVTVLGFDARDTADMLVFAAAGDCLVSTATTHLVINANSSETAARTPEGYSYVPLAQPRTLLDTFTSGSPLRTGTRTLAISGPGVPAGAGGAALRVTAVGDPAFVVSYRCDSRPLASDLSVNEDIRATTAFTRVDASGRFCFEAFVPAGTIDVIVELLGYFTNAEGVVGQRAPTLVVQPIRPPGLVPIPPERVLDTRTGLGAPAGTVPQGGTVRLDLASRVGPATDSVVLNVTATEPEAAGYVTVYPCDAGRPDASNLNFDRGENVPNLVTVKLSGDASVCLFAFAETHLLADLAGRYDLDGGQRFAPLTPTRILDTRTGLGAAAGRVDPAAPVRLQIAGVHAPVGATAVTLNLTATEGVGEGYLTAYPCDAPRPEASNVNYVAAQNVPNLVTVKLAGDGSLCLFAYRPTHVLADLAGWYGAQGASGLFTASPERVFDTRSEPEGKLLAGDSYLLDLGLAGEAIDALVINTTVDDPDGDGFVTAYPCDSGPPDASNLNFAAGDRRANLAVVKVAASDGTVCFFTYADTHLLGDLSGYFTSEVVWVPDLRRY